MVALSLPAQLQESLRQLLASELEAERRLREMERACSDEDLAILLRDCREHIHLHLERLRLMLAAIPSADGNGSEAPAERAGPADDDAAIARQLHTMVADSLSRHFAARLHADMLALFEVADMIDMSMEESTDTLERLDEVSELVVRTALRDAEPDRSSRRGALRLVRS